MGFHVFTEYGPSGRVNNGGKTGIFVSFLNASAHVNDVVLRKIAKKYKKVSDNFLFQPGFNAEPAAKAPPAIPGIVPAARRQPTISITQLSVASRIQLARLF